MPSRDPMERILVGAVAGFVATAPMTLAMAMTHRRLPWWQRYATPPKQIVGDIVAGIGVRQHLGRVSKNVVTSIAHFTYGACMGVPYATLEYRVPGKPMIKGTAYGAFVWIANYLIGLPAANFSAAATREPSRRIAMMIFAYLIWGATLGAVSEIPSRSDSELSAS